MFVLGWGRTREISRQHMGVSTAVHGALSLLNALIIKLAPCNNQCPHAHLTATTLCLLVAIHAQLTILSYIPTCILTYIVDPSLPDSSRKKPLVRPRCFSNMPDAFPRYTISAGGSRPLVRVQSGLPDTFTLFLPCDIQVVIRLTNIARAHPDLARRELVHGGE